MQNLLLPESGIVNGQLVGLRNGDAWSPQMLGPFLQNGTTPVPSVPPGAYGAAPAGMTMGDQSVLAAQESPWSPSTSPLLVVVAFLIIGLLGLRYVHWHD